MLTKLYYKYLYKQANFEFAPSFQDVYLQQQKNPVTSRLSVDTGSWVIRGVWRPIPLISANMMDCSSADFIIRIQQLGGLGVLHRAMPLTEQVKEINKIANSSYLWAAASVGVGPDALEAAKSLIVSGANIIVIDIAHGYTDQTIELAKQIKQIFPYVKIVIGNTTNPKLLVEAEKYIDAVKVGIAGGSACETRNYTGCYEPTLATVFKFKKLAKALGIPVIADGGIKEPGDVVKCLAAGANSVMAGSIFARCPESPAEIIEKDGQQLKVYSGMASRKVQEKWRSGLKPGTCVEGKTTYVPVGESVNNLLERYQGGIRSGLTYSGATNIEQLQKKARFIRVSK